ncbi:tRNA (adenosine(37)-N6)-threonylcarbamoyltransferase complex ATPase subunit type 1 TsaE [Candidatus Parcubacteria bacterium]|nr:tRNA (adenosine(37)-N6)-threonylcarbamoyltransferase complex ATPase subunit type 1 TsaE [Candidatus Parcubacteria bacterium]
MRETRALAKEVLAHLAQRPRRHALVVVLSGNLGAGKTAFVRALAGHLGVKERVQSPTFVLEKVYALPARAQKAFRLSRLVHIDAYRLERPAELLALGFESLAASPENLVVIEWGERVRKLLPKSHRVMAFTHVDKTTRHIALTR